MIKIKLAALFIGVTLHTFAFGQALDSMTVNTMGRCIAAAQIMKAQGVISGKPSTVQIFERLSFNLQQKIYASAQDENQRQAFSNSVQEKLNEYGYMGDRQQLQYASEVLKNPQCFALAYNN